LEERECMNSSRKSALRRTKKGGREGKDQAHHVRFRFVLQLQLWLNLAIAEKELGLPIPDEAIVQMKANLVSFNFFDIEGKEGKREDLKRGRSTEG